MDNIPTWIALVSSLAVGLVVAILVQLVMVPWQRKKILGQQKSKKPVKFDVGDTDGEHNSILQFVLLDVVN
jgi:solute carrier family 20 (sodium-dependent phosphate transporter)